MGEALQNRDAVRAALFVDFDNIYTGLRKVHPQAAAEFATNPAEWLAWFERGMPSRDAGGAEGARRRAMLLRHCYLNPQTFGNYRAYFTRAAFRVVDCPSLTLQNKNSTDIHMVMDILDALRHKTHFDEFIILSGDSDFTPVLLRLRLHDRRTVILTTGPAAQPYKAASDRVISEDVFIEDGLGILPERAPRPAGAPAAAVATQPAAVTDERVLNAMAQRLYDKAIVEGAVPAAALSSVYTQFAEFRNSHNWLGFFSLVDLTTDLVRRKSELVISECAVNDRSSWEIRLRAAAGAPAPAPAAAGADDGEGAQSLDVLKGQILARVKELVAASASAVNMAWAAGEVIRSLGPVVRSTEWAGAGSFKDLLLAEGARGFEVMTTPYGAGFLVDPSRHAAPADAGPAAGWDGCPEELAAFARRINRVTGAPLLRPDEYSLVFNVLEGELRESSYFLSTTSRAVRDRCAEIGRSVPRKDISFILKGITYSGHDFEADPLTNNAGTFAAVFKDNVLKLCRDAQLELSEEESRFLDRWITP